MATEAYFGNPNIARQGARARQIAQARNVSDIADPRTYGFMQGLLGSAPDQLGYSVFDDPETRRAAQQAAEVGLVGGGLLQSIPVLGPVLKGYGRLAAGQVNRAMMGEGGLLGPITPQPMYVVPPGKKMPSPYPQQQALDLAQQRAALPVEQGGLGLPASNTPMDRARAIEFDTDAYHATDADIMAFDNSKLGSNTSYLTGGDADAVKSAMRGHWFSDRDLTNKDPRGYVFGDVSYPVKLRNPKKINDKEFGSTSYIVKEPDQIRSRFAAFDPFRKDVATATAMGVALPDLLAAEYNQQPQSSGLLYPFP